MKKEFNEGLSGMLSLMERMDKHMTSSEAEYNKVERLDEAIATGSGKMQPKVLMTIDEDANDNGVRTRVLKVWVGPLFRADAMKLERSFDCSYLKYDGEDGVIFTKQVPLKNEREKKAATPQATDPNAAPQATDPSQAAPAPKKGLFAKLNANKNLTEGLLNKLKNKAATPQATDPNAAPQATDPSQAAPSQATTTQKTPNVVIVWLEKTVMGAIKTLYKNPNYDTATLDKICNIVYLTNKYLTAPVKADSNYHEKTTEEVKKAVAEAIKNGDWANIANVFSPINLEAIIFGNVLSKRNQMMIATQAADRGIDPTSPDYPTNLYAPGQWTSMFGRRVVDNPKGRWYTQIPMMADRGSTKNLGSLGHYEKKGQRLQGFKGGYLYDISDTERIPLSDYPKYGLNPSKLDPNVDYHTDVPGLKNNITGELNPLAIAARDAAVKQQESSLTDEQVKLLNEIQSDEGKAKIFNDAILAYAEAKGINGQVQLIDVNNSQNALFDYAKNLVTLADATLKIMKYANPSLINPLRAISAFAIGCETTGAQEVLNIESAILSNKPQMLSAWDNACAVTLQFITELTNYMIKYLMNKYVKFNDSGNSQPQAAPSALAPAANAANQNVSAPMPVNESIESLLDKLFC